MAQITSLSAGVTATLGAALAADTGARDDAQRDAKGASRVEKFTSDDALHFVKDGLEGAPGLDYETVKKLTKELSCSIADESEPERIQGILQTLSDICPGSTPEEKHKAMMLICARYDLTRPTNDPTIATLVEDNCDRTCTFKLPENYHRAMRALKNGDTEEFMRLAEPPANEAEATAATKPAAAKEEAAAAPKPDAAAPAGKSEPKVAASRPAGDAPTVQTPDGLIARPGTPRVQAPDGLSARPGPRRNEPAPDGGAAGPLTPEKPDSAPAPVTPEKPAPADTPAPAEAPGSPKMTAKEAEELNEEPAFAGRRPMRMEDFAVKRRNAVTDLLRNLPEDLRVERIGANTPIIARNEWLEKFQGQTGSLPLEYVVQKTQGLMPQAEQSKHVERLAKEVYGDALYLDTILSSSGLRQAIRNFYRQTTEQGRANAAGPVRSALEKISKKGPEYQQLALTMYEDLSRVFGNQDFARALGNDPHDWAPLAQVLADAGIKDRSLITPQTTHGFSGGIVENEVKRLDLIDKTLAVQERGLSVSQVPQIREDINELRKVVVRNYGVPAFNGFVDLDRAINGMAEKNAAVLAQYQQSGNPEAAPQYADPYELNVVLGKLTRTCPAALTVYEQYIRNFPTEEGISRDLTYQLVKADPTCVDVQKAEALGEAILGALIQRGQLLETPESEWSDEKQAQLDANEQFVRNAVSKNEMHLRAAIRILHESGQANGQDVFKDLCEIDPGVQAIALR